MAAEERRARKALRARPDACIQFYRALGAEAQHEQKDLSQLRETWDAWHDRSMTRHQEAELFPAPGKHLTLQAVAAAFCVDERDTNAALLRESRARANGERASSDLRMLGTPEEKGYLSDFAKLMAERRLAQTRFLLATILADLLRMRKARLSHVEERFLEDMKSTNPMSLSTPISPTWFKEFEAQYGLQLQRATPQDEKRIAALTYDACKDHFAALDLILSRFGFLDANNRIKPECT